MGSSNGQDRSLSELERDAERTRAELMHTVEALHHRVSPQVLKAEAKEYVRHTSEDFISALQQRARENPLQAVAVGAGLAYPIWRIATSMPIPLMLIGAGIALGRSSGRPALPGRSGADSYGTQLYYQAREKAEQAVDTVRERVQHMTESVQQTVGGVAEQVSRTADQVTAGVRGAQERASEMLDKATSTAGDLASRAASVPSQMYENGTQTAQDGRQAAQNRMQAAQDGAGQLADRMRDTASRSAARMRETGKSVQHDVVETIQQHPLLVGALGLAAGAVLAAALPSTRVENRVFGKTAANLRDQAQEFANEGVERARTTANDVYQQAVEEARMLGLSPDMLRDAVRELASKAKTVAQNATGQPTHAEASSTH